MMQVHGVEAFADNYIWVIQEDSGNVAVVDPGDAEPVIAYLLENNLSLSAVLITHKHYDHIGGITELKTSFPDVTVYGPANEPIEGLDHHLHAGDTITIPDMQFSPMVMDVPGHTEGHIAYLCDGALFCGDTLFSCGCGRVFSGTMQQLHASLRLLASLPPDTKVYCAHEYTQDNIGFAKWVEPENVDLIAREQSVNEARSKHIPTVPSELATELATNPFLRTEVPQVKIAAERYAGRALDNSEAVFTTLRQWKDREYD